MLPRATTEELPLFPHAHVCIPEHCGAAISDDKSGVGSQKEASGEMESYFYQK